MARTILQGSRRTSNSDHSTHPSPSDCPNNNTNHHHHHHGIVVGNTNNDLPTNSSSSAAVLTADDGQPPPPPTRSPLLPLFGNAASSFPSFRSLATAAAAASSSSLAASSSVGSTAPPPPPPGAGATQSNRMTVAAAVAATTTSSTAATAASSHACQNSNHHHHPHVNEEEDSAPPPPPQWKKIKKESIISREDLLFEHSTDDEDEIHNYWSSGDAAAAAAAAAAADAAAAAAEQIIIGNHPNVAAKREEDDLALVVGETEEHHSLEDDLLLREGESAASAANDDANNKKDDDDDDEDSLDGIILREEYDSPDGNLAFCCQNCTCLDTKNVHQQYYFQIRNNCGNSSGDGGLGNTKLFHRGCCHGHKVVTEDYVSPMQEAIERGAEGKKLKMKDCRYYTKKHIKKMYTAAMREEAKFENEEFYEDNLCSIHSNLAYNKYCTLFQERLKVSRRSPLRVLDLFSGIGSGTVVLKRLKLPISLIVHVEHDPIAVAVCKSNHQHDNIEHLYAESFESIYGKADEVDCDVVASFVKTHGPIDLVLSAAPCQNYSGLNARRDQSSDNAQYLLKVGRLIHKLDDIQMSSMGVKDNVLFLSENVVFKNHDEVDKSYAKIDGEALTPVCVDAKDFGPCKRKRFYWVNVPINSSDCIKEVAAFESVDKALDNGYGAVARLFMNGDANTQVKANTFLASSSKIDDDRMLKLKIDADHPQLQNRYNCETYSVRERERMMGLPIGYVQQPLCDLFHQLAWNAFIQPETSAEGKTYRDFLPRSLWHIRRKCKFKFYPSIEPPFFRLALSSPLEGKKELSFFTEEEYCKHLIGNGWSIPVVEHLLGKLRELFDEDALVSYQGFDEAHPWEPYLSM